MGQLELHLAAKSESPTLKLESVSQVTTQDASTANTPFVMDRQDGFAGANGYGPYADASQAGGYNRSGEYVAGNMNNQHLTQYPAMAPFTYPDPSNGPLYASEHEPQLCHAPLSHWHRA